ncbi:restriction endonuclease subunit S [Brenneria goodwinii]|uniref:restriction endonuclease subunit S n=1 Tax=Brenneria goodwinii TaxID=1109412 RepID=UPI0036E19246
MAYAAYEHYKQSGIKTIGLMPQHWSIRRLKFMARIQNGKDYKGVVSHEGYPVIGSGGEFAKANTYLYNGESVLLGRKGTIDRPLYINGPFWTVDTMFYTEISADVSAKYLYYCSLTINFLKYATSTALPSMTQQDLGTIPFAVPEYDEQQTIASFLNFKTAQIDALISKQKALLDKLAEKRTALISHAVTKGLNPSVPMKDSGVAWLGEIPEHWKTKRLRFCMTTNPSKGEIKLGGEELVSFVPMDAVGEFGGLNIYVEKELDEVGCGYTYFAEDDVVVAKITPCFENGKGAIARGLKNSIAFGTTELHVLRAGEMILPDYLFHLTMSHSFRCFGESEMYGAGGQKRVPETFLKDFRIGLPPLSEQQYLVAYINKVNQRIDLQMRKTTNIISRLTEYRSSLITNAVTGKIDVRDFSIPEQRELQQTEYA